MITEPAAPKLGRNDPDVVVRSYKFALKPTTSQERKLRQHTGAARFVYNYLISQWRDDIHTRAEEKERGVPEDGLTPFTFKLSAYDMRNYWNRTKGECAPWWPEVSKEIGNDAARRAHDSIENWHDSRGGKRKGRRVGFPRFHKRGCHESCTFSTGTIRVNPDRHSVALPRIGTIKTRENTRELQRKIAKGTARITQATISRGFNYWHVSFTVYEKKHIPETHAHSGSVAGTWVWEITSSLRQPQTVMKSCVGDCRNRSRRMKRECGTFSANCRVSMARIRGRKPRPRIGGFARTTRFASIAIPWRTYVAILRRRLLMGWRRIMRPSSSRT